MKFYKVGDNGPKVKEIQTALGKRLGVSISSDGIFGRQTEQYVMRFQRENGLLVDGIVGDRTAALLGITKQESRIEKYHLSEDAFARAASMLMVPEAAIKAVAEVESSGYGFTKSGNPVVRLERHHVYKYLTDMDLTYLRDLLVTHDNGLCDKTMDRRGAKARGGLFNQFNRMMKTNKMAAIYATSFGRFQIMGFNYQACGYVDMLSFHKDITESENKQLLIFCQFIKRNSQLHDALRELDWKTFARIYNGPKYAMNQYDVRMAKAYAKYQQS